MSNRLFQTVIHQLKDAVGRTVGVIDENGIVIACSELARIGESKQRIREHVYSHMRYEPYALQGWHQCLVMYLRLEYVEHDEDSR